MSQKSVVLYLGLAYGLAWIWWFATLYPVAADGSFSTIAQLFTAAGMFAPALAVVLTRAITREGFHNAMIVPVEFKRRWKYYLLAWFGPLVLVVAGAVLYFLIFPADFDPSMGYVVEQLRAAMEAAGQTQPIDDATLRLTLWASVLTIPLAPVLNAIPCFGEEWGWRGYLLPKLLERFSVAKALLISGVAWGLWHAPITILGHNYGLGYVGFPVLGIVAMCVLSTVLGVFMSYVTIRSGSCLPAVIAHGMLNGCASLGTMFSASGGNPFVGPAPTGIVSAAFFVVAAVVMARALRPDGGVGDVCPGCPE